MAQCSILVNAEVKHFGTTELVFLTEDLKPGQLEACLN
jgi:hypothetical protein